nr:receptor-like protein 6 [Nicotiana tomentosiformis]
MINFQRNNFSGEILSSHWVGLENLIALILRENSLSGLIPASLFSLLSLQFLDLSANNFTGQITEVHFVTSSQLRKLYLVGNNLEGPIPGFFFELCHLQELALSYNKFNGYQFVDTNISESELALLPHLSILRLASCNLYNINFLKKQSELTLLDLSINHIKGEIPNWIWDGGALQSSQYRFPGSTFESAYGGNSITTTYSFIPPAINLLLVGNHLASAVFLSITNNTISGTIPSSICSAANLEVLDLSSKKLSGKIPACLAKQSSRSLKVLNFGRNNVRETEGVKLGKQQDN